MPVLLVGLHGAPTMRTDFGLGDDDLVRVRMQGPAPTRAPHTGLATRLRPWAQGEVCLRGLRRRHTRIVGVFARLVRCGCECRELGFQALHLRPQRRNEGIFFRLREACQLR
jgi:hypothetical protein